MEVLSTQLSLSDKIESIKCDSQKIKLLNAINSLLTNYETNFGKKFGFIHNDLHLDNIQYCSDGSYKIIDFGRCFIQKQFMVSYLQNTDIYSKYGLLPNSVQQISNLPYCFPPRQTMRNLVYKNIQCSKSCQNFTNLTTCNCGYMCDIAQVAFNLLRYNIFKPSNYSIISGTEGKYLRYNHDNIIKAIIGDYQQLQKGLLWLIIYLNVIHKKFNITDMVVHNNANEYSYIRYDYIINEDLYIADDKSFLAKNGMIKPYNYNNLTPQEMISILNTYNGIINLTPSFQQEGGGNSTENILIVRDNEKVEFKLNEIQENIQDPYKDYMCLPIDQCIFSDLIDKSLSTTAIDKNLLQQIKTEVKKQATNADAKKILNILADFIEKNNLEA